MSGRLAWLIGQYFPPVEATDGPPVWNDWQIDPAEDADLLRRMLNSRSAAGAFGGKVSFQQLWDGDAAALGRTFPDPGGTRPFDASSADAALAQHLAFWTRRDHERMRRLMWQSKLAREKWNREDYLPRTVAKACAMQREVLAPDRPPVESPAAAAIDAPTVTYGSPAPVALGADIYMTPDQQIKWFGGCVYVVALNRVLAPGGFLLNQQQFDVVYGGRVFSMDNANGKVAKGAWDAFTHSQALRFPMADVPSFRPELPFGTIVQDGGRTLANTYWPIQVPCEPGDIQPFTDHMAKLFPDARDLAIIVAYLAALVQYPGDKFQYWPLVQGAEGNGKSLILSVAEHAVGHRYCHRPNASDLGGNGGKFTGWIQGRLLIGIEEIKTEDKNHLLEILKPIVTNDTIEIQAKGADQVTGDNRANGLMFTNYKDAIPQRVDNRRYAIFYTPQQTMADIVRDGMGGDYFPRLYGWLRAGGYARVTHWLKHYPIPAELSPAVQHGGMAHRAPVTSSTTEAVSLGLGRIEQEVLDAIGAGEPGFCGGWISSVMLGRLIRDLGLGGRGLSPLKQAEMLRGLGYVPHPWLTNGRVNNIVSPDGKKPVLYVKAGHLAINATNPAEIARLYASAQPNAFGQASAAVG